MTLATRSMIILDETGDTTIGWDEETDAKIIPIIEERMKQGFTFYIIKPTAIPRLTRKVKAKSIEEVRKAGHVFIKDEALEKLLQQGAIATAKTGQDDLQTVRKAANANDVATNHSVAIRPVRGG